MPGFKQVPAGSSYSRITKGSLSQKHRHISTSDAAKNRRITGGYWYFVEATVLHDFFTQSIKRGLKSRS